MRNAKTSSSYGGTALGVVLGMLLAILVPIAPAVGAESHFVVTYFAEGDRDGESTGQEWRIFDPVRRTDELFRVSLDEATAISWDTTETEVEFVASGSLMRVNWEVGALPWPVLPSPQLKDTQRLARRAAMRSLEAMRAELTLDRWGRTPEIIRAPAGESPSQYEWYFIALRSSPERGVAFRIGQPTPGRKVFLAPLYLMDRRRGTQVVLATPELRRDEERGNTGMAERDGFLLVSCLGSLKYVFDLKTGEQIFKRPARMSGQHAVWVKRPRTPRVDEAGLRRLRARFR